MPFSDIAALSGTPFIGIADEATRAVPETAMIRFEEVDGLTLKQGVITAHTGGGYHDDNEGADWFTLTTDDREFKTYPLSKLAKLPVALHQGVSNEILAKRMEAQIKAQLNAASQDMSVGLWAKGAKGPDGLYNMAPSENRVYTSGIGGVSIVIWFVNLPAISFGIGNNGGLTIGDIKEETVFDDNQKPYRAYVTPITMRATNILRDYRAAVPVLYNTAKPLTLNLMLAAIEKQYDDVPFTHIFMSRSSQSTLRGLISAEQELAYTQLPKDYEGLPIVTTPNIGTIDLGS